jgi:uncharacterized cupredoxin-like copper-binding protein
MLRRPDSFRAVLAALSTAHQIGMLVVAGIFIVFALLSSFVFPRYWPQFPGSRGLTAFVVVSLALFVAMLLAVEFFAVEEEAEARDEPAAVEETTTTTPTETAPTTTEAAETTEPTTTATAEPRTITVSGTEFAFALSATELGPGSYVFELRNEGDLGHDLAIAGPGVDEAKTPVIDAGETAEVDVELQSGDYELWCTVPGHREAGMEAEVTVS